MQIFARIHPIETVALDVEASDSIESVRTMIQQQTGIAPGDQYLIAGGKFLEDGRTLADYNIQRDAIMNLQVIASLTAPSFTSFPASLNLPIRSTAFIPRRGWMVLNYDSPADFSTMGTGSGVISLFSYGGSAPGQMDAFDPNQPYEWDFLNAAGGISGFNPDQFTVNTNHFENSFAGTFAVAQSGPNSLALTYSPIPEPDSALLFPTLLSGMAMLLRRRAPRMPDEPRLLLEIIQGKGAPKP